MGPYTLRYPGWTLALGRLRLPQGPGRLCGHAEARLLKGGSGNTAGLRGDKLASGVDRSLVAGGLEQWFYLNPTGIREKDAVNCHVLLVPTHLDHFILGFRECLPGSLKLLDH